MRDKVIEFHWVFSRVPVYLGMAPQTGFSTMVDEGHVRRAEFGDWVERYQGRLYAQALGLLGDPVEAEESTQEAFVRAYVHRDELREPGAFLGWIATILSRIAADRRRGRAREKQALWSAESKSGSPFPDPLLADEESRRLWQAVAGLPEDYRTAFLLVHLEGLSYREVAEQLGVPVSTIEGRMYKAKQSLRERLK
jgi:RNA polymerase sigma-70 factor (ECF subfamily)